MKGIHKEFGLNPSIEFCKTCGLESALLLLGDNIPGQAPEQTFIECNKRCLVLKLVVLIEVVGNKETGYCLTGTLKELGKYSKGKPGKVYLSIADFKKILGPRYRMPGAIDMNDDKN